MARGAAGVEKKVPSGPSWSELLILRYTIFGRSHVWFPKVGRVRTRATRAVAVPMTIGGCCANDNGNSLKIHHGIKTSVTSRGVDTTRTSECRTRELQSIVELYIVWRRRVYTTLAGLPEVWFFMPVLCLWRPIHWLETCCFISVVIKVFKTTHLFTKW